MILLTVISLSEDALRVVPNALRRIFGETAALIFTADASVSYGQTHREALVSAADRIGNNAALVLLVMVLVFNVLARVVGRQLSIRLTGKV